MIAKMHAFSIKKGTSSMEDQMQRNRARNFANRPAEVFGQEMPIQHRPIARPAQVFHPLPAPTGLAPYHLSLSDILPAEQIEGIRASKRLIFHVTGDTGGVKSPEPQLIVMKHMGREFDHPDPLTHPAFFYNLGDVVYYYGEAKYYHSQFYEPTIHYPAPIFAIPGNHDGDVFEPTAHSLAAFVENFCAPTPRHTKEAGDALRDAMTQPNVYWTLEAPFVTIIGLYTNVPDGAMFDEKQVAWLESELAEAPRDKALLLAMHNPIYSADGYHHGSTYLTGVLDSAIERAGRVPDLFLAGHVHNYQRFTRSWKNREIPYLVAGTGGFWQLYALPEVGGKKITTPFAVPNTDVTLENYCDDHHGYMRLEVSPQTLKVAFLSVPRPHEAWSAPAVVQDSFTLDLQEHRLLR